jgi:hypothetical protein
MNGFPLGTNPLGTATSLVTPITSSGSFTNEPGHVAVANAGQAPQSMAPPADNQHCLPPTDENQEQLPSLSGSGSTPHHPIAEFLYQLTKMLTDDNNEIVEWTSGKIRVHHPERLEAEVLHKYFRHSKFASFQRQLNYFGFRKIAGKGKMSPCSYVNDGATTDLRSLLLIKRKTNGSAARKAAMAQRVAAAGAMQGQMGGIGMHGAMPMSAEFFTQALMSNPAALMGNPAAQQSLGVYSGMMYADAQQQAALQQVALQRQALQSVGQHQKPHSESLYLPSDKAALAALVQSQGKLSAQDLGGLTKRSGLAGSLEQLQQLTAARNSALNLAGFGWPPSSGMAGMYVPAPALHDKMPPPGPAAMPATAAMNATAAANAAASNQGTNVFESSTALNALVGNNNAPADSKAVQQAPSHPGAPGQAPGPAAAGAYPGGAAAAALQYPGGAALQHRLSSSNLLRGLPSAGTMFPDSLSSVSLSGLLPGMGGMSSNRLNSMLSLSSFLSRDPSMADLLPGASNVNLAGLAAGAPYSNGFAPYSNAYPTGAPYSNGYTAAAGAPLGNTTLVPLTGSASASQFDFAGASAALQSLANAAGPASAFLGAWAPTTAAAAAPVPSTSRAPAPAPPAHPPAAPAAAAAGTPVGFEPTPIQDMGQRQQQFAA